MGSIHWNEDKGNVAQSVYRHLVDISSHHPYIGQHEQMSVSLTNEIEFRSRKHFKLMSFETFFSWDDDREIPNSYQQHRLKGFNFDGVVRLNMHWRNYKYCKYANGADEDIFECYIRRPHGDWTKTLSFLTVEAEAQKRGIPLLTKTNYDQLIAESAPDSMAPQVYSEVQRLIKIVADERNYLITGNNISRALYDGMELESAGMEWAKANGVVTQNINGEYHK